MPRRIDTPDTSLIAERRATAGGFADAFVTRVPGRLSLAEYVFAFYTSPVFRAERVVLGLAGQASTDEEARDLANGQRDSFAVWDRAERRGNELMMHEASGATASWFMVRPVTDGTEIYFGSHVRPRTPGADRMPFVFRALLGFHLLYSRVLLASAARRARVMSPPQPDSRTV